KSRAYRRKRTPVAMRERESTEVSNAASVREVLAALDEELARLPEKLRGPLILCYLEERTHNEAARQLDCPLGTLRSRLERGTRLLRNRLVRRGIAFSTALLLDSLSRNRAEAALTARLMEAATAIVSNTASVPSAAASLADNLMSATS